MKMEQKNIIIENLRINYYQSENLDKNNCIVFLHGWGSEALHLKSIFENCANFIAIDLPGFGKSDLPQGAWSIKDYSELLNNLLQKLGIQNPILVGHSVGGNIAIKYAVYHKVKKLIIIAGAGIRKKTFKIYFYWVMTKILKIFFYLPGLNLLRDKLRRRFYKAIGAEDYIESGKLKESFKRIIKEDLSEDMKKIKAETILIWGKNDKDALLKNGQLMRKLIDNSKFFIIKNAGHFPFLDQPEEFNKIFQSELKC